MPIADYSATADNNTSISGINVAEGCLPSNVNNAIRQLMADLAQYKVDVDTAIAAAVSTASANFDKYFPKGCRTLFQQEAAPTGWKKVTTYNDCALRLTSGDSITTRTNGYTFSGCFASGRGTNAVQISMGTYDATLSVGQLAAHGHSYHSPGTMKGYGGGVPYNGESWGEYGNDNGWWTSNTGSNRGHSHGTWNNAHAHSIDFNVNFIDVILCERS